MEMLLAKPEASNAVLPHSLVGVMCDFHNAMAREEFILLFQPIVHLASGNITGVEALVRWDHPTLGRLGAKAVLDAADAAGMAIELGEHLRAKAMREVMAWPPALGALDLALNMTAADPGHPGFFDALTMAMARSGFPSHRLILEITEDRAIPNIDSTVRMLERLHRKGISVVIDDFGTGFSSLSWIAQLPVAGIKLDRSFTKMMRGNQRERHVVKAVAMLAQTLGLSMTAEGIEEPMDIVPAFSIGCDAMQGFGISPPLSSEGLAIFVAGWVTRPWWNAVSTTRVHP